MRKFIYQSKHIRGDVLAGFHETTELLLLIDISTAEMSNDQHYAFMLNFPRCMSEFFELVKQKPTERTITEIFDNVSFNMFWDKYNHKSLSSKRKTEKIWDKMAKVEQQRAYNFIVKYDKMIAQAGHPKKHAETYLNSYLWDN